MPLLWVVLIRGWDLGFLPPLASAPVRFISAAGACQELEVTSILVHCCHMLGSNPGLRRVREDMQRKCKSSLQPRRIDKVSV